MHAPGIRITRYPYEEPHHLNLFIEASNGRINGLLEYYGNTDDLKVLGKQLADFTGTRNQEVIYTVGSEDPKERSVYFLSLRVKPLDASGHCAVLIRLNNRQEPPRKELSEFSIEANVADVNRLGSLFIEFGRLEHLVLDWRVQSGRLFRQNEGEA